ncbi:MAG TPA: hypothetical protein DCF68_06390 [Cyanothece sp. UBA12306]|nr:hypothetical protein [Cyanothece sp. UBA12306]
MGRFLYEKSISYQGNLIIPFLLTRVGGEIIYSYALLCAQGYKNQFHKAKNPSGLCSNNLREIIEIAENHLDQNQDSSLDNDYFQQRYTYQNNLIILHQERGKCYYDHYLPHELRNIAAPTLFTDPDDCMNWIKQRLDSHRVS